MHKRMSLHENFDHMGEAVNLVNNFKVDKVVFNNDDFNELETELIKVLSEKGISYYKDLDEISVYDTKLYFLTTKIYDNENDNSNVLYT